MISTPLYSIYHKLSKKIAEDLRLWCILLLSLSINLVYIFWFADFLLGDQKYIAGDTSGWTDSFLNLIKYGTYTFDTQNEMASFGRVPGFSFFWGIHYLLFGAAYVYQAVAFTQAILGTICTYLIFSIASKIYPHKSVALLSAFLYATYPFTLYWITVSYAEPLSNFINLLCINMLLIANKHTRTYFIIGILSALAFYTREFMGFILVVSLIYILFDQAIVASLQKRLKACLLVLVSFLLLYSLWPLRNYIYHDKVLLGREYNGFKLYNEHLLSYTDWVHCWDNNDDKWIKAAVLHSDTIDFPNDIFQNQAEEQKTKSLIKEANQCATSFIYWRQVLTGMDSSLPIYRCDEKIKIGFDELRESFIKNHPWRYAFEVPIKNIHKVFFKSQLQEGSLIKKNIRLLYLLVFRYRTSLLILAIVGLFISRKNYKALPIAISYFFILFFMCFLYRYIEMRNFMQTDVLLIIPCSYCLVVVFKNTLRHTTSLFISPKK